MSLLTIVLCVFAGLALFIGFMWLTARWLDRLERHYYKQLIGKDQE